jgi:hypothetical protein
MRILGEWRQSPPALQDLDLDSLIGMSVAQAGALVEGHDGHLRTYTTGEALHLDFRPNRVTVRVEHDHVASVRGIG